MLFSELVEAELDSILLPDVNRLPDLKKNAPEIKVVPKIECINRYPDSSIEDVRSRIVHLPENAYHGWEKLNQLFLSQLQQTAKAVYTTSLFTSGKHDGIVVSETRAMPGKEK